MKLGITAALALTLLLAACGGAEDGPEYDRDQAFDALGLRDVRDLSELGSAVEELDDAVIDPPPAVGKDYNPVFPDPLPFDPAEWETGKSPPSVADPDAKSGGTIRLGNETWPPTIRTEGPNSRLAFLSDITDMVYETMLGLDAVTMKYVPNLATHWQIADDKMTYRFRLDPRARWADGREVTADDVVATVEHMVNPDRKDPLVQKYWDDMIEYARMLDKYTVEIKTREPRWRNFITISNGLRVYPAAYIRMDGATYLEDWNWKLPPGTGPYEVRSEDIKKPRSITLRRRKDWWQGDFPENKGTYNFDRIEWHIIRDRELMYQKLLAGEIDLYIVGRAQRWVDELDREPVIQKGWVQKRKIFNKSPEGYGGFCFNVRNKPFDDVRVRKAFAHLFNREKLFEKILLYQYEYMKSYFPGQPWEREDAERMRYDPEKARQLLAEAGWTKRDNAGYLVNERGERFPVLTLDIRSKGFQRIFDVVIHDLMNEAGIEMKLNLMDNPSWLKKVWDFKFQLVYFGWTAGLFPEPIQQFHSKYANLPNSNNLNGFADPDEADTLMEDYQTEFDPAVRKKQLQRLDEILFENHLYALGWYAPFFRIIYWDKFGHPPEYCSRANRDIRNVLALWWIDPEREASLAEDMKANRERYPDSEWGLNQYDAPEQRYWLSHDLPMPDEK